MQNRKNWSRVFIYIIVHNCCTQYSTEQFWLSSLLFSRQAPELRCYWRVKGKNCVSVVKMSVVSSDSFMSRGKRWHLANNVSVPSRWWSRL